MKKIKKTNVILKASPLHFYSPFDEDALFEWLNKIHCITDIKGIGKELHISINQAEVNYNNVRELRGIFKRYNFDIEQLKPFLNEDTKHLFE